MLVELTIQDFALIDRLTIPFAGGLTVLTGETGAGKSIIIDALSLALGERADTTQVRSGCERALVAAVFDVSEDARTRAALEEAGLPAEEDGSLVLTREVWSNGKSRCRANGRVAPLSAVRGISAQLVDIHGQHEHQVLIREENHLEYLDTFGGAEHAALRAEFRDQFQAVADLRAEIERLVSSERARAQRLDVVQFQLQELTSAALEAGEDERLAAERRRLANAERLQQGALGALQALRGEAEGAAALDRLGLAQAALSDLRSLDTEVEQAAALVDQASYLLEDAAGQLSDYQEQIEADPARLEEIERRLDLIARFKRKYGDTIEDILAIQERLAAELQGIETSEDRRRELEARLSAAEGEAAAAGERLSASRQKSARKLATALERELAPLGMPKATFQVAVSRQPDPHGLPTADGERVAATARGLDQVQFELSTNPGEPPKPLARIASGGELSRLMLAFKSLCSRGAEIPTLIFDEVDAGIGGRTAHAVGQKLARLATGPQVLCVTHLPQIARISDHHLRVVKTSTRGRTSIQVVPLAEADRVDEIARLLGAAEQDATARRHATEMLETATAERAALRNG